MDATECFSPYSKPYGGRPKYDGKNTSPDSRPSVFWRLGASASNSAGSVFSRLSGLGGGDKFGAKGSSWHKITVSCTLICENHSCDGGKKYSGEAVLVCKYEPNRTYMYIS